MPTSDQRDAVRFDTGSDAAALTDAMIDALYLRAESVYPTPAGAQEAWVRVLVINGLMAQAAKRADYKQNESTESMSQVFNQLAKLKQSFLDELDYVLSGEFGIVRFGALRRVTPRIVDIPDDAQFLSIFGLSGSDGGDVSRLEV